MVRQHCTVGFLGLFSTPLHMFYIINFYFLCYISFYVACAFVIKYLLTYLLKCTNDCELYMHRVRCFFSFFFVLSCIIFVYIGTIYIINKYV